MTAASTSDARKRAMPVVDPVEVVARVVGEHHVECTGLGEATCGACRDLGWMPWRNFHDHIATAAVIALRAEGLLA